MITLTLIDNVGTVILQKKFGVSLFFKKKKIIISFYHLIIIQYYSTFVKNN